MFFRKENADIYYEIYGEGDSILLIAGLASDSFSWWSVYHELSKKYKVIVFDNRYCGKTKTVDTKLTIETMARDARDLLKYLEIDNVNIVGHSMGGMAALRLAAKFPERINKVIAAACPSSISTRNTELFHNWLELRKSGLPLRSWFENIFFWIMSSEFFTNTEILKTALDFAETYQYNQTTEDFQVQVQALSGFSLKDDLPHIESNVLVIAGEKDILIPADECRKLADNIDNSEFMIIPGAAHSIHLEKASEFVNAVEEFLN